MQRVLPDVKVRHEDCSVEIFRLLLKKNNIQVSKYGLTDIDLTFIEEIIRGTKESERKGRCFEKFYLYDIVNNSRSGLDVDKLDYFQRDIKFTNVYTNSIQFQRFLEFGRVMKATPIENPDLLLKKSKSFSYESHLLSDEDDDINNLESTCNLDQKPGYMICYPVKMVGEALQLFMLRYHLHQKVYTHKSVKKVEYMVCSQIFRLIIFTNCNIIYLFFSLLMLLNLLIHLFRLQDLKLKKILKESIECLNVIKMLKHLLT